LIITNNPNAGVIDRAERLLIPVQVFSKQEFSDPLKVLAELKKNDISLVVLAGFLLLVPPILINAFPGRIVNIHPALLPEFGGKGFYGDRVHSEVINAKSPISGITIHHVNHEFDKGEIIFQAACHVAKDDSADSLAHKIHQLEYTYFPVVLEKMIQQFSA
jgi:phosphoribosylglycinamide formyltransferase-1